MKVIKRIVYFNVKLFFADSQSAVNFTCLIELISSNTRALKQSRGKSETVSFPDLSLFTKFVFLLW